MKIKAHIIVTLAAIAALLYAGASASAQSAAPITYTIVGAQSVSELALAEDYGESLTPRIPLLFPAAPARSIVDDVEIETLVGQMDSSYLWVENVDDEPVANPPPWGGSDIYWSFGVDRVLWLTESPWRGRTPGTSAGLTFLADGHYSSAPSNQALPAFDGTLDYWGPSGRRMAPYSVSHSYIAHASAWAPELAPDGTPLTVTIQGQPYAAHQLWYSPRAHVWTRGFNYGGHGGYQTVAIYAHVNAPSVIVKVTVKGHFQAAP